MSMEWFPCWWSGWLDHGRYGRHGRYERYGRYGRHVRYGHYGRHWRKTQDLSLPPSAPHPLEAGCPCGSVPHDLAGPGAMVPRCFGDCAPEDVA